MDSETIKKVEKLAKLKIEDSKFSNISKNLIDILSYVSVLQSANLNGLPTEFNASGLINIAVPDNPVTSDHLSSKGALKNAKRIFNNYFQVDKVI